MPHILRFWKARQTDKMIVQNLQKLIDTSRYGIGSVSYPGFQTYPIDLIYGLILRLESQTSSITSSSLIHYHNCPTTACPSSLIRYAYPLRIRYNKLSYSLPVHITLTQPIPLFSILYLSDNQFYTYPISSLLVYYWYSVVYLSVILTC
jgi:hypothetical protein